ncbi:MAG TPA: hypothetical protein PLD37_04210 [Usitatibacteraceae bacterium]|jgi:hypothetical protein|nr:hypothetical protein [Usitatibacteraceae bacterium]
MRPIAAVALFAAVAAMPAPAALPPQVQNLKDLDVLVAFARRHARVAAGLKSIDVRAYVVHYGENCRAEFARPVVERPPGWAGPQPQLVYVSSNCPLD